MRIVLVNWAPIWEGANVGGGVNGYCQALALALLERGHEVVSLFGGLAYVRRPRGCFVRRHDDWLGVRIFEVVNSPVLAPSIAQFRDPLGEISQPELEGVVADLLAALRADVVHWHNLEGFSAGCIRAAKQAGARVVYSLHNYHTLCSQVTLTRAHRWACHDFDSGHACASCVDAGDPDQEKLRREADYQAGKAAPLHVAGARIRDELALLRRELGWPKRAAGAAVRLLRAGVAARRIARSPDGGLAIPGRPINGAEDVTAPWTPISPEARGQAGMIMALRRPRVERDPRDVPVLNVVEPDRSAGPPTPYADRRRAMVEALASCDRVLAVSRFVARKFEAAGVPARLIRTLPIGSRINEVVRHNADVVFDPPPLVSDDGGGARPIRVAFLGFNHFNKGLPLLADALELMSADRLRRIDLSIFANGGASIEWRFRRMEPRLARLVLIHGYQFQDIPWCLGGKDLTYVGSTWWDPAPQTVFESFACGVPVLGADLGGIPDFVHDGVNGLLFRGNDPADLARCLAVAVDDPAMVASLRRNVRPPKDIQTHAAELERLYAGAEPTPPPPAPTPVLHRRAGRGEVALRVLPA